MPHFDLPAMQWITSTALTVASITIALVAVTFGYRQNYGWKPAILLVSQGISEGPDHWEVFIEFELWNRHKYPIAVQFVEITFGSRELGDFPEISASDDASAQWYRFRNKLLYRDAGRLDPASHKEFSPTIPLKKRSPSESQETASVEPVTIEIHYFDPIANKRKIATLKHKLQIGGVEE